MMTIAWALCAGSLATSIVLGAFFHDITPKRTRPLLLVWFAGLILGSLHLIGVV